MNIYLVSGSHKRPNLNFKMESDTFKMPRTKQCIKVHNLDGQSPNYRKQSFTIAHLYLSPASLSRQKLTAESGVSTTTDDKENEKKQKGASTK